MSSSPEYRFQFLDHTADVAVVAYGHDLREAFASAARAMFEVLADLEGVGESLSREVQVAAEDPESLLVDWLNDLLFLFDAEHLLLSRFQIQALWDGGLRATVYGEPVEPNRHRLRVGIKAVTYHMLEVRCDDSGCHARVVFDV